MDQGEILQSSINLYRAQSLDLIAPILVSSLVSELLRTLVGGPSISLTGMAATIVNVVLGAVAGGAIVRYASELLEGRVPTLKDAIYYVLPKLVSLVVAGIVIGLLMFIGAFLFIVPGILIAVIFFLTAPVIVIEQLGVIDAMKRSRSLAEGRWTRIFALLLLLVMISVFVALPAIAVVVMEVVVLRVDVANAMASPPYVILSFLSSVLVGPLTMISETYLYYSLKAKGVTKSEGLPPPPPPP